MLHRGFFLLFLLAMVLLRGDRNWAGLARPQEPLVEQVRKAIDRAKDYLIKQQTREGHWEVEAGSASRPGGWTSMALLALLNAGVPPEDPIIQNGLRWLRTVPPAQTYVVGLQTMVFCLAGQNEDRELVSRNVKWLVDARRFDRAGTFVGWTYTAQGAGQKPPVRMAWGTDNSNMQYALLGLHEAQVAGFTIDPQVWRGVRDYYLNTRIQDDPHRSKGAGWGYQRGVPPSLTMTTAGLCGLLIAGMDLNQKREIYKGGQWEHCGQYEENQAITQALEWLGVRFPSVQNLDLQPHLFYALYGFERAGRLTGLRFLGEHDWYRVGCEYLVARQNVDGSWMGRNFDDSWPLISTSFGLLFLSKGRTPILISKLTHEGRDLKNSRRFPVDAPVNNWNNDRNDARHLVEFASRELFKRQPMGWQVFNTRQANIDKIDDLVSELLQSPVVYISGHWWPEFLGQEKGEKGILRKYVENGGFILAEACCGRPEFDQGFRELMNDLFPDSPLRPLPPEHPIWTASGKFAVPPNRPFPLEGIQMGCKTVVIYSPKDLSCYWESNQYDQGDTQAAFRLGANIIAYATGLEPPRPRLTPMEVLADEAVPRKLPRGFLKAAHLRHDGDWQPAPRAIPTLMRHLRDIRRLDVSLQTEAIRPDRPEVNDFKFLYMHGRSDFHFPKDRLSDLRFNLENGGLLFADATCGSRAFDKAFRELMADLWPERKLERIPLDDDLFGKELNGREIKNVRCRREADGRRDLEYRDGEPFLEGMKINNRWVVIYSKYDIGCALEKTRSPDCLAHDYESALRLGSAVVMYALKR